MARRPLPDEIHELHGTKKRAETVTVEALGRIDDSHIPEHLPDTAAVAYVETVRALNDYGLGAESDAGVVESYALALGLLREASEMLRAEGMTHTDDRGTLRKHPCIAIANQATAQIRQLAPLLGLSPAARAGLEINKRPSASGGALSEWDDFIKKGI